MSGSPFTPTICAQVRDDLPAFALGILDADEQARVAAHLEGCRGCQEALRRFELTVGTLGMGVEPASPPAGLRGTLLQEITRPAGAIPRPPAAGRFRPLLAVGMRIAAMLAIVAAVTFGILFDRMRNQRDEAREDRAEMAEYLKDGGSLAPLLPASGAPDDVEPNHGSLALAPDQDGAMITVYGLPPTSKERRYLVWAQRDGQDKVKLGELSVDDQGFGWMLLWGPEPMATYNTVGITRVTPDRPQGEPFLIARMPQSANT